MFETRYRVMVKDALAGRSDDRGRAAAAGWEQRYAGNPEYFPWRPPGAWRRSRRPGRPVLLKLAGSVRVRLGEVVRDAPYRLVRAEEIPERPVDESDPSIRRAKLDLLATQVCLVRELTGTDAPRLVLDERMSFAAAVNGACASLPTEAAIRQALLELDDLTERHRRAVEILDEILKRVLVLKSAPDGGVRLSRRQLASFRKRGVSPFQS